MNLIRKIRLDDYAQISKIIKLVFFKQNNLQNGFLMSHIRKNIFEKLINSSKYCYVLEEDDKIKAFLLAYSNTLIKPTNDINKHIINSFKDKFIYIYQIGVSPKFQKMGLGTLLYKKLFFLTGKNYTFHHLLKKHRYQIFQTCKSTTDHTMKTLTSLVRIMRSHATPAQNK